MGHRSHIARAGTLLLAVAAFWPAAAAQVSAPDPVAAVGGARWTSGNSVRLLSRPREAWQARLEIVRRAQHHIHITTFSWHNDTFGKRYRRELVELMERKQRQNPDFRVRILVDATTRGVFDVSFSELVAAGAEVRSFNPLTWAIAPIYDLRMHDKMIVVDGRWAIVGGRNISDKYFDPERWWLDFGIAIEGEAVHDLQMQFLKTWAMSAYLGRPHRIAMPAETLGRRMRAFLTTGRLPGGRSLLGRYLTSSYFPTPRVDGQGREVAILYDNPLIRRSAASTEILRRLVDDATAEIDLMTPFPNMTRELISALVAAVDRGVRLRLFVNGSDAAIRRGAFLLAGLPTVIELIEAGAEVWAWSGDGELARVMAVTGCSPDTSPPIALHGKLARIDDDLTIVHSSNFNIRSTYYNTEAGALIRGADFNREVETLLDGLISLRDLARECGTDAADLAGGHVVVRLGVDDVDELRALLRGKQKFVDSLGVVW